MYKYFEDYSNRLCTFNFENWPYRGAQLKPSKLASIGYECKEDGLYCNSCQSKYVIPDPSIPNDVVFKQAYNTHEKNCPELLIQFKISKDFLHVYGLIYYNQCIESQKEAIKLEQTYLEKIPQDFHYLVQDKKKVLAIFGWLKIDQFLVCKFCGRKCEIQPEEEFDVFGEHRYFCKWANEGKNFKYGYLTLLQKLRDQSGEVQKTSEHDTMKVQIMSTLEDLIKASQSKQQEEQKVQETISSFKEILNKRKRFNIEEFEKDWENIEAEKKKKIKIQTDLIAQQKSQNQEVNIVVENDKIQQQQEIEQLFNEQGQCQQQFQELTLEQIQLSKQLEEQNKIIEIEEKGDSVNKEKLQTRETEEKAEQLQEKEIQEQIGDQPEQNQDETNVDHELKSVIPQINYEQKNQSEQEIAKEDIINSADQNYQQSEEKQISNDQVQQEVKEQQQFNQQDKQDHDLNKLAECEQPIISRQLNEIECEEEQAKPQNPQQEEDKQFIKVVENIDQQNDFQELQEQQVDIINPLEEEQNIHTKINLEEQAINTQEIKIQDGQGEIQNEENEENHDVLNNQSNELQEEKNSENQLNNENQLNEAKQENVEEAQQSNQIESFIEQNQQ